MATGETVRGMTQRHLKDGLTRQERAAQRLEDGVEAFRAGVQGDIDAALAAIDPADTELVRVILSRIVGPSTDAKRRFGYFVGRALDGLARTSVPETWANGRLVSSSLAPLENGPVRSFQVTESRLKKARLPGERITAEWQAAEAGGSAAQLSDLTLGVVIDPRVWPHVPALLREGPDALLRRLHVLLRLQADNGLSGGSLHPNTITPTGKVIAEAVELRARGWDHPAIVDWNAKPRLPQGETFAPPAERPRQTIPRSIVRKTMRPWWKRIEADTRGGTHLPRNYFRTLRLFLFATILLTTGTRYEALQELTIDGYEPDHAFPDGSVGPAIGLRVGKQKRPTGPPTRWKALPPAIAPYVELYIQAANLHHQPDRWPFWPGDPYRDEPPANPRLTPLPWSAASAMVGDKKRYLKLLSKRRERIAHKLREQGASDQEIEQTLSGVEGHARRALFPLPNAEGPWHGHSPHLCRKFANNALAQAATIFLDRPEGAEFRGAIDPYAAARAVLDQKIGNADFFGYGVGKSVQSREAMSRLLCPIVFDLIVGDLGAPTGIDVARLRELQAAAREMNQAEEDLHLLLGRIAQDAADEGAAAHARLTKRRPPALDQMPPAQLLGWFQERGERLAHELAQIHAGAERQRADVQRQLRALSKQIRENDAAIQRTESTQVPLPEVEELMWLPEGDEPDTPDTELDDAQGERAAADDVRELLPVRQRLLLEEVARLLGKSPQTVRRWLDPDYLTAATRTDGVPWTGDDLRAGRIVITESERRRFINAEHLDRTKLTVAQQQELRVLLAQAEPRRSRI